MRDAKGLRKIVMFRSDGCSGIPDGAYSECCDEHDFYYACRGAYQWEAYRDEGKYVVLSRRMTRRGADRKLYECMQRYEDKLFSRFVYVAVRLFGWIPWWRD